jgi:tetratricopeptide (TPR) repeat protein
VDDRRILRYALLGVGGGVAGILLLLLVLGLAGALGDSDDAAAAGPASAAAEDRDRAAERAREASASARPRRVRTAEEDDPPRPLESDEGPPADADLADPADPADQPAAEVPEDDAPAATRPATAGPTPNPPAGQGGEPTEPPPSSPVRPPPSTGVSGQSREYDNLHCLRIQAQHGIRIPAGATVLEVNGDRLAVTGLADLQASTAPVLFLPKGTHAVRFRPTEQAVEVTIAGHLADEESRMRAYFGLPDRVRTDELLLRGARTVDVHGAPFLLNLLGASYAAGGRLPPAERKFRRAIRVNPTYGPAHLNLAWCAHQRGAAEEAARELRLAEEFNVGNVFGLAGAIADLKRELKLPSGDRTSVAFASAGYVSSTPLSEEDVRLTALMTALADYAVEPADRGKVLNNLAVHFAQSGRTEQALEHFRQALSEMRLAGPRRFALSRQVLGHMGAACRRASYDEAEEYERMHQLVSP